MPRGAKTPHLTTAQARRIWLAAQKLDQRAPFGSGAQATPAAVAHLGYVQIDTINVIERSHHHILWTRIPDYRRAHLRQAQTVDKSVFEYWTHALAYVPSADLRHFVAAMRGYRDDPGPWFRTVDPRDLGKVMRRIRRDGAISIRDIDDDVLVEKDHAWASRKPSRRAMQFGFFSGRLAVSERVGMLKTYDLIERHFGWETRPRPAPARETNVYLLDRALRAQGIVSLDSICHLDAPRKAAIRSLIDGRVRRRELVRVDLEGAGRAEHWAPPHLLDGAAASDESLVHLLSPFDPLIIQRKRLKLFFGYDHLFEAYVPKDKRKLGYFALPALVGDRIAAAIDIKADRDTKKLLIQKWTWIHPASRRAEKAIIEEELHRFARFQFEAPEETAGGDASTA